MLNGDLRYVRAAMGMRTRGSTSMPVPSAEADDKPRPSSRSHQRTDAIKWAMPYPPRMTAAKLPATTARRKAAVMVYSIKDSVRHPLKLICGVSLSRSGAHGNGLHLWM
jgi:hypothetical protein